jgi:hypothetical protein
MAAWKKEGRMRRKMHRKATGGDVWRRCSADGASRLHRLGTVVVIKAKLQRLSSCG